MARPADPTRARRGTGNRPQRTPGTEVVSLPTPAPVPVAVASAVPEWAEPPLDLPVGAVDIWRAVVDELLPRRLRPAQIEGVRMMVTAAWRYRQASDLIEQHGILVKGQRGPMPNPALRIEKDASSTFLRLAEAYGLTPAAQMRLGLMQLAGESILSSLNGDLDQRVTVAINAGG